MAAVMGVDGTIGGDVVHGGKQSEVGPDQWGVATAAARWDLALNATGGDVVSQQWV